MRGCSHLARTESQQIRMDAARTQDGRGEDRILTRGAGDHTSADPRRIPITIVGRSPRPDEELRVVRQYGPFGAFGVRSPDSIE
ncbi:hypothetical protein [Streptomyces cyaneofuscatus]|uniref:hypothetical protein n=1 Tax=Streptomyces cyaneofuscatus TaxID=66883 RepID=UPI002FEF4A0D